MYFYAKHHSFDCGVYMCKNIEYLCHADADEYGVSTFVDKASIKNFRKRIQQSLVENSLM